jgi:hypothetical protein
VLEHEVGLLQQLRSSAGGNNAMGMGMGMGMPAAVPSVLSGYIDPLALLVKGTGTVLALVTGDW